MLVRGFARQVALPETMTGSGIYEDMVARVEKLNGATHFGYRQRAALTESLALNVERIPEGAFKVVLVRPSPKTPTVEDDPGYLFGIHGPYRSQHLLVMPDLNDVEGVERQALDRGQVIYGRSSDTDMDIDQGFTPSSKYASIALGIAGAALPGGNLEAENPRPLYGEVMTVATWVTALGLKA